MERTAATGTWGTVEWAIGLAARAFFLTLAMADQAKILALFQRLADTGRISNEEKFKRVTVGVWEFKSFQLRFLGDFRPGRRFVVAFGIQKKGDKLAPESIRTAQRILAEHDQAEKGGIR